MEILYETIHKTNQDLISSENGNDDYIAKIKDNIQEQYDYRHKKFDSLLGEKPDSGMTNFLMKGKRGLFGKEWSRLGIEAKSFKLSEYIEQFGKENKLDKKQIENFEKYIFDLLDEKVLTKKTNVEYNVEDMRIMSIKGLVYKDACIFYSDDKLKNI